MEIGRYKKLFGIGPIGLLISLIALGLLWLLDESLGHVKISRRPAPLRMIGACLIAVWLCWHAWCMSTLRQWYFHDRLCTTGPYRFVRHPVYSGGVLVAMPGFCLLFNSWIVLLLPAIMFAAYSFLVRKEEAMMLSVFGEEYQHYASRTGRLFPRIFP